MPTIKATTPEELKAQFVLWAREQAAIASGLSRTVKRKREHSYLIKRATTYSFIADYWEKMEIEK